MRGKYRAAAVGELQRHFNDSNKYFNDLKNLLDIVHVRIVL